MGGSPPMVAGQVWALRQTQYVVRKVQPYPNAKKRLFDRVVLSRADGSCKHELASWRIEEFMARVY